jgi:hypothetical protein
MGISGIYKHLKKTNQKSVNISRGNASGEEKKIGGKNKINNIVGNQS